MQHRETIVIPIDPLQPDEETIEHAAALLRNGQLVVFPTETVYGLGANALETQAVEQIFAAKARPFSDPLIVHIAELEELYTLVTHVPENALRLAHTFWPGPLTIILPANQNIPGLVTAGLPNVAIRMPSHPVARALLRAAALPIAAPSANRFMHVSPTTAQHAYADLNGRVPLILDGGPCSVGVESTVLNLCSEIPTILRPGGISLEALQSVLPQVQSPEARNNQTGEQEKQELAAPGQMLIHYSPHIPTYLVEGNVEEMRALMQREIVQRQQQGERVGLLLADEDLPTFQESGAELYLLGKTNAQVATRLFAGLRTLEEAGVQVILCRTFSQQGLGLAVRDRLLKAAGGKVISH
ncbi:threonylcarbamoyl-AMP synthase [Ktedonobacteria bacterium brp13]|nr:threonylcarbamoyl-AMP synthase [Ktedonobacteria bacterium brp13]